MVGLIFAQLYENFPIPTEIDEAAIADAMGVTKTPNSARGYKQQFDFEDLPSGDPFWLFFGLRLLGCEMRALSVAGAGICHR
jgi:hypothetical protein